MVNVIRKIAQATEHAVRILTGQFLQSQILPMLRLEIAKTISMSRLDAHYSKYSCPRIT